MKDRAELKYPDKFCWSLKGKLYQRFLIYLEESGLRPSDIFRNAVEEFLTRRGY